MCETKTTRTTRIAQYTIPPMHRRARRRAYHARLPLELWGRVFSHLRDTGDLNAVSQTCRAWHHEVFGSTAEVAIWRQVWDAHSLVPGSLLAPTHRTLGRWLAQVRASLRLALRDAQPERICVPPRYLARSRTHPDDDVPMRPRRIDVETVLGRATCVHTSGTDVTIGFERGVGVLCFCGKRPVFHHKTSPLLGGLTHLVALRHNEYVAATTTRHIAHLALHRTPYSVIRWRPLDCHDSEQGALVSLGVSSDGAHIGAGFDDGRVRVLSVQGGLLYNLSMRESADMLCIGPRYLVAACHMQPIGVAVWDLRDGRALHRFDQTSVGWEEVTAIAGVVATPRHGVVALWSGKDTLRHLDLRTGYFRRTAYVRAPLPPARRWGATDEGENGAPSAHVGPGRVAPAADRRRIVVASANIAFVVHLDDGRQVPLHGARRTLVRYSSDERSVITADTDAFGGLGTWVAGRNAIGARPTLRVWDARFGVCKNQTVLPSAASELSVAANVVAVLAKNVGQVVVLHY